MKDEDKTKDQLIKELIEARSCIARMEKLENERQAAESELNKLSNVVKKTADCVVITDKNGVIEYVNPAFERLTGYSKVEAVGKTPAILKSGQHDRSFYDNLWETILSGEVFYAEFINKRKDGSLYYQEGNITPLLDNQGTITHFVGIGHDVTERKIAEEELRNSEQRFHKIFDHSNDAIIVIDPEKDEIIDANSKATTLLGYTREELLSMPISAIHPDEMPQLKQFTRLVVKQGSGWTNELTCFTKQGSHLRAEISASVIELAGRNCILALVRDISERLKAEQALRESEDRLSRIIETAMDAIITFDTKYQIKLFNRAAEQIFCCRASEAIGQSIVRFQTPKFQKFISDYIQSCANQDQGGCDVWAPDGLTALRADSEEIPIEATVSQVVASGQRLYTMILRDINERKKVEAELNKLQLEKVYLQEEIKSEYNFGEIIGASDAMKKVFKNIDKVAATDSTVLIVGETGTGKELVARTIHNLSARNECPLIKLNCAALPIGLIESELFGHEKGAFTGATAKKKGRFELADNGTIFLDEVGELPFETQIKLLRVLQEQEFERVGGSQTIKVNVRVIAATNRNLEAEVNEGGYRADLFYRLNIFPIHLPSLKERVGDIELLSNYFIKKFFRRIGKKIDRISPAALEKLRSYNWPGNVRELANILERAAILCEGRVLQPAHIGISNSARTTNGELSTFEEAERLHIQKALEKCGGVVGGPNGAAKMLGLKRTTLLTKMQKLGIDSSSKVQP